MASLSAILKKAKAQFGGKKPAMKKNMDDRRIELLGDGLAAEAGKKIRDRKKKLRDILKETE